MGKAMPMSVEEPPLPISLYAGSLATAKAAVAPSNVNGFLSEVNPEETVKPICSIQAILGARATESPRTSSR